MLFHAFGGTRAKSAAQRLSPLHRGVFIGCTLVTAFAAMVFTTGADVSAPADIAKFRSALKG